MIIDIIIVSILALTGAGLVSMLNSDFKPLNKLRECKAKKLEGAPDFATGEVLNSPLLDKIFDTNEWYLLNKQIPLSETKLFKEGHEHIKFTGDEEDSLFGDHRRIPYLKGLPERNSFIYRREWDHPIDANFLLRELAGEVLYNPITKEEVPVEDSMDVLYLYLIRYADVLVGEYEEEEQRKIDEHIEKKVSIDEKIRRESLDELSKLLDDEINLNEMDLTDPFKDDLVGLNRSIKSVNDLDMLQNDIYKILDDSTKETEEINRGGSIDSFPIIEKFDFDEDSREIVLEGYIPRGELTTVKIYREEPYELLYVGVHDLDFGIQRYVGHSFGQSASYIAEAIDRDTGNSVESVLYVNPPMKSVSPTTSWVRATDTRMPFSSMEFNNSLTPHNGNSRSASWNYQVGDKIAYPNEESLIDYLAGDGSHHIGDRAPSFPNRHLLAEKYGIYNYSGLEEQNRILLKIIKWIDDRENYNS